MNKIITVKGLIQGIGYRPFVCKLANEYNLSGWVKNTDGIVTILASGEAKAIEDFASFLRENIPAGGQILSLETADTAEVPTEEKGFYIASSNVTDSKVTPVIPADLATCEECERELFDENNRRYQHPFISCVKCGPRYTVIRDLPYDRNRLVLDKFPLCKKCSEEYNLLNNRRAYAQTISCKECGPALNMPIEKAAETLKSGKILAIKDIGGFHLACVLEDDAIDKLRKLKNRPTKPFAIMSDDFSYINSIANVNEKEIELLKSPARPIVLLNLKQDEKGQIIKCPDKSTSPYLGVMLPSNPVQLMLSKECGPLIMTSANISGGMMITSDQELEGWINERVTAGAIEGADIEILTHNRDILVPLDDSIYRVIGDRTLTIRRARGYVPLPIRAKVSGDIFAAGSDLKATFAYSKDQVVYMGPTLTDLDVLATRRVYENEAKRMKKLFGFEPESYVCDCHPLYNSSKMVEERNPLKVQHHRAHVASVMAEHFLEGEVLGFALDGTGYGDDGTIWGSEVFTVKDNVFTRVRSLTTADLVASDLAAKDARLSAFAYMAKEEAIEVADIENVTTFTEEQLITTRAAIKMGLNRIKNSSLGRLFDAVAAVLGICEYNGYEGQCAQELEYAAARAEAVTGRLTEDSELPKLTMDRLFSDIIVALKNSVSKEKIALAFHLLIAEEITRTAMEFGIKQVVLSGGCFNNRILTENTIKNLEDKGFFVYINEQVSCGDAGLALGEIYVCSNTR